MRRRRKLAVTLTACSLAITGILPGAVSAAPEEIPRVADVRVLKERNYLEIRWNQEVQNSIDPANYVLKNGDREFHLLTGNWNTMYFEGYALSSIGFEGTVDESQPLTLEIVEGNTIENAGGNRAEADIYSVDYENYYTQFYTSETGILVKASDDVQQSSLVEAASQIDHMLGKTENGIAERMAEYGASLALYGPHENAYFIPEHRNAWDPDMYEVEGYGGSQYNDGVSSIAEKNVIRVLDGPAENQTGYRNENILVHEFGHAVKLLGMDLLEDPSLHNEFVELYNSRKQLGMWPNTYAISNEDEFFATMCTVWFSVMEESPDWSDGVRGPVNTRDDLMKYDPETYEFFSRIFPEEFLDAPWDPSTIPDRYDDIFIRENTETYTHNFGEDTFKIFYSGTGDTEYHLEQYNGVVLWWNYGDEDINSWKLTRTEQGFHITTLDGSQALAPVEGDTVALADADISDPEQLWEFVPEEGSAGRLIHASDGRALGLASVPTDGTALRLVDEEDAAGWRISNLSRGRYLVPKEGHDFANTYFQVVSAADNASVWENWESGVIWNTVDSDRNSWKIVPAGDGWFRVVPLENPDMVLAPQESGTAAGTRVMLTELDETDETQLWSLQDINETVRFVNKASGLAVSIENHIVADGSRLVLAEVSGNDIYQQWKTVNKTTGAALEQPDIPNYAGEIQEPPKPTEEPEPEPSEEPTPEPSKEPTEEPTPEPSKEPTEEPTPEPSKEPTEDPTPEPSKEPTEEPAPKPSKGPTEKPDGKPSNTLGSSGAAAADTSVSDSAQTGDASDLSAAFAVLVSAACAGVCLIAARRRTESEK